MALLLRDTQAVGVGKLGTATLCFTTATLKAVRAASICRQGILLEQEPSLLWAEPLPMQKPNTCQQVYSLHVSPDARLCAIDYLHTAERPGAGMGPLTRLALYETLTGRLRYSLSWGDAPKTTYGSGGPLAVPT